MAMVRRLAAVLFCLGLAGGAMGQRNVNAEPPDTSVGQRRAAVLVSVQNGAAALPFLKAALNDASPLVRRAAVQSLQLIGPTAVDALNMAVRQDKDALVRRTALRALNELSGIGAVKILAASLNDPDEVVRRDVVTMLATRSPQTPELITLLRQARQDKAAEVSRIAASALWPFYKETLSSRERTDMKDHHITTLATIPLPTAAWRFKTDPDEEGHQKNWFTPEFDDRDWSVASIGKPWEEFGQVYDGIGWYRSTFTAPEKTKHAGVDLTFDGVDDSAWVWINGQYIGQHDLGPSAYGTILRAIPFSIDVTDLLKWGEPNQITVRVLDRGATGGITQPVKLEILNY
jgi:hypothetical protein